MAGVGAGATGAEKPIPAAPVAAVQPKGMKGWLNSQPKLSTAEKENLWETAVKRYRAAKRAATQASKEAMRVKTLFNERKDASERAAALRKSLDAKTLPALELELRATAATSQAAEDELQESLQTMSRILKRRPGFFANLLTLWGAGGDGLRRSRMRGHGRSLPKGGTAESSARFFS
ncbi:hypothetical protein ACET33_30670 [Pseudomonas aeruginosa]